MYRVMLVDDEPIIVEGLMRSVEWEKWNCRVVATANDGVEGKRLIEEERPDIVFLDICMPEMDGLTLLRKLRDQEEQVRFIILTGYDEFAYAREAVRLDVENYILKPIDEEELIRQLRETVRKLEEMDRKKLTYIDEKTQWMHFLNGKSEKSDGEKFAEMLGLATEGHSYHGAVMKWNLDGLKEKKITNMIVELKKEEHLRIVHLPPDSLLMILDGGRMDEAARSEEQVREYFSELQNQMESRFNIMTFICVGASFQRFEELPEAYRSAKKDRKSVV